jgi:hypothetical protein
VWLKEVRFLFTHSQIWWLCSCHIFLYSCQQPVSTKAPAIVTDSIMLVQVNQLRELSKQIKNGDILTRTGNDFTSYTLRNMQQKDKTYSHCGIVSIEKDSLFVYHALGGEFNPHQTLLRERLSSFCNSQENKKIGLFRLAISQNQVKQVTEICKKRFTQKIPFDMDFNLATKDSMYCAEFVATTIHDATQLVFDTSKIKGFAFFGVDNIIQHKKCSLIFSFNYKY